MKTKGITIWERYVHYMVLGVAVLIFVGFAAMQLLTEPNAVADKAKGTIKPSEIDGLLETKAKELQAKLGAGSPVKFPPAAATFDEFAGKTDASVSPVQMVAAASSRFSPVQELGIQSDLTKHPYVVPKIPAPTGVVAREYWDTLDEEALKGNEELGKMFTKEPYDVHWVTALAVFPIKDALATYSQKGPNGELPIPTTWYQVGNGQNIFDVVVEREELVDGNWTSTKVMDPLPGQFTLRTELKKTPNAALRTELVNRLGSDPTRQTAIVQPAFYATLGGNWAPPDEADAKLEEEIIEGADPTARQIAELKSDIARTQKNIAYIEKQLDDLDCPKGDEPKKDEDEDKDKPEGGSGGAGPPRGGLGGAGLGGRGGDTVKDNTAECKRLRGRLKGMQAKLERDLAKLAALDAQAAAAVEEVEVTEDTATLKIWAHDLTVEPGKTYRYRFTVQMYNPFFAHRRELIESQYPLAEALTMASEASEWSQAVSSQLPVQLFVTDITSKQGLGGSAASTQARAEVFRFSSGRWWSESFIVQQGDLIGDVKSIRTVIGAEDEAKPGGGGAPEKPPVRVPGTGTGIGAGGGNPGLKPPGETKPEKPKPSKPEEPTVKTETHNIDFTTDWFVLAILNDGWNGRVLVENSRDGNSLVLEPTSTSGNMRYRSLKQEVRLADL